MRALYAKWTQKQFEMWKSQQKLSWVKFAILVFVRQRCAVLSKCFEKAP